MSQPGPAPMTPREQVYKPNRIGLSRQHFVHNSSITATSQPIFQRQALRKQNRRLTWLDRHFVLNSTRRQLSCNGPWMDLNWRRRATNGLGDCRHHDSLAIQRRACKFTHNCIFGAEANLRTLEADTRLIWKVLEY